jgi:hypothetical protein
LKKACDLVRREVLYNILLEFGIPMKLVRLIKMYINETCSRVRVSILLPDMLPIRNGFKEGDAIKRVQVNTDGLKLNGTHQLLVHAHDVITRIMGGNVHTMKENTEDLLVISKAIGREVNADKTQYIVVYRDQNAGGSHNIKMDNSSSERVEEFKYVGTTLIYQNSIEE